MKFIRNRVTVLMTALIIALTAVFSAACSEDPPKKPPEGDGDVTYSVTVERSGGDAFSDMLVVVLGTTIVGRTDSDGKYSFTAPAGTYNLMFDVPEGYANTDSSYVVDTKNNNKKFSLSASLISTPATSSTKYGLGSVMHDFAFTDSTGKAGTLSGALAAKKAVMLNFWFAGCGPCVGEFPDVQEAYEAYEDDIEIIAISLQDDRDAVEAFRTNANHYTSYGWDELTFRMVGIENACRETLIACFGVTDYPTTVIIDREGVVCFIASGPGGLEDFMNLFERYTAADYTQYIQFPEKDVTEKPDIPAPSSARIAEAINGEGFTADYYPDSNEYNWPWIIGEDGKSITASNKGKKSSFSVLYVDFEAEVGQILAFDYSVSTEEDIDLFGVFIDNELMHTFSGVSSGYKTCYAYVPLTAGRHTLALSYTKDDAVNAHSDTVSVSNMRFVSEVGERTEILYRCAWGFSGTGDYSDHVDVFYNESDGYYHVGTADGPLVVADILNATKPSWAQGAWEKASSLLSLEYDSDGDGTAEDHLPALSKYASIANNSKHKGRTAVTKELKNVLDALVVKFGDGKPFDANEWLDLCYYYAVYGGETGEIAPDPTEGLAIHNAYPTTITAAGQPLAKNHVNKTQLLMPRGIYYEIRPQKTAVYRMRSVDSVINGETEQVATIAWLYAANGDKITENSGDVMGDINDGNFYITMQLEEGKAYYLALDFQDIDVTGEFDFVVEEMGESGTVWTAGATGPYSFPINEAGEQIGDYYVVGAVDYIIGDDNCYHVKNPDGSVGPLLYINLLGTTNIFPFESIEQMLKIGNYYCGGYYCMNCGIKFGDSIKNFEEAEEVECWCGNTDKTRYEIKKSFELPTALEDPSGRVLTIMYKKPSDSGVDIVQYVPFYDLNTEEDITDDAKYVGLLRAHGIKFIDYTDIVEGYVAQAKDPNNDVSDKNELGGKNGGVYEGFVPAHADLIDVIQKFIVFGNYSMSPQIKNAWLLMCGYFAPLG